MQESPRVVGYWWGLAPVMTGTFMGGLDTYIVNVSLPTVANSFGVEVAVIQWVPLAYLVVITSALVLCGRAADLWGSRRLYMGGLLTFVLGSALCGAAPVGGWLSDRLGPRLPATMGLLLVTATVVLMAVLSGGTSALTLGVVLGVYGLGAGLFQSPNNSGVLGAAPRERLGIAFGTLATMRQLGQIAGIAIASTVWVAREQAYLATGLPALAAQGAGFRDTFLVLASAGLLAVVASVLRGRTGTGTPGGSAPTEGIRTGMNTQHASQGREEREKGVPSG
jgi:MFS family permease